MSPTGTSTRWLTDAIHTRATGTYSDRALVDADLLHALGIPLFLMFDRTRRAFTDALNRDLNPKPSTDEERRLATRAHDLKRRGFRVTCISQPHPDIAWTIPEEAVKRVVPSFPGWRQVTAEFRPHDGQLDAKKFLEKHYELNVDSRTLARLIKISKTLGLEPGHELKAALATVLSTHR